MQIPGEATEQRSKLQPDDAGDLDCVASLLHAYGILCQAVLFFGGLSLKMLSLKHFDYAWYEPGSNLSKIKSC